MAFRETRPFDGSQTPRLPTYAASIDMSFVNCRCSATFHWLMRAGRPASGSLYNPPHTLEKLFNWPATVFTPGVKFCAVNRAGLYTMPVENCDETKPKLEAD